MRKIAAYVLLKLFIIERNSCLFFIQIQPIPKDQKLTFIVRTTTSKRE